jgi:hypothetical protein
MQLAQFRKEFPLLMQKITPTYICIAKGGNKEVKSAMEAFERIVAGEREFVIAEAALLPAPKGVLNAFLNSGEKAKKEIGTIASSLL